MAQREIDLERTSAPPTATVLPEAVGTGAGAPVARAAGRTAGRRTRSPGPLVLAAAAYLGLAVALWINLWTAHPTSVTTCGCGDIASTAWYLGWPAHALTHGLSLFHSTALGYPKGLNLLANTSELALGLVLAPVTWLFGPIATLNVALTLSPALSALAMFAVLRRWVSWAPAAFVGGLLYGFSPFVLAHLTEGHVMFGLLLVPPLLLGALDELLLRQRRRPVRAGIALGLLVCLQFFIGTETLVITAMMAVVGIVILVVIGFWRYPAVLVSRARHAIVGLAAAGATTAVVLAYPAWYALAGPTHLSGWVWPGGYVGNSGTILKDLVLPNQHVIESGISPSFNHTVGGYQGFLLSPQYFGIGIVVALVAGFVLLRRDRRLWFFGALALVATVLSIGEQYDVPLPWFVLVKLPLVKNILPGRIIFVTYLCVVVMIGIVVDRTRQAIGGRAARRAQRPRHTAQRAPSAFGPLVATCVAAAAIVPPALYLAQAVPFTTRPVVLPAWFRDVAPRLPAHQVLLVFPTAFDSPDNPKVWQAVDGYHYSMAEQGGPGGVLERAGRERAGQAVINDASNPDVTFALPGNGVASVRQALHGWRVTMIVIPDQPELPVYERIPSVTTAAALMTAATGQAPVWQDHAWVWRDVDVAPAAISITPAAFASCTAGLPARGASGVGPATSCVLGSPTSPTAAG